MRKEHASRTAKLSSLSALGLLVALATMAPFASAQETKAPAAAAAAAAPQGEVEMAEAEEVFYEPLQVGDATQGLLAWQRSGEIASPTPRPIAGTVANRSYERYLKTFEFPIPERMSSIVKSSTSGGSGSGAAR
jgi:hypothetical protein